MSSLLQLFVVTICFNAWTIAGVELATINYTFLCQNLTNFDAFFLRFFEHPSTSDWSTAIVWKNAITQDNDGETITLTPENYNGTDFDYFVTLLTDGVDLHLDLGLAMCEASGWCNHGYHWNVL